MDNTGTNGLDAMRDSIDALKREYTPELAAELDHNSQAWWVARIQIESQLLTDIAQRIEAYAKMRNDPVWLLLAAELNNAISIHLDTCSAKLILNGLHDVMAKREEH
jgi:hypothetical protein